MTISMTKEERNTIQEIDCNITPLVHLSSWLENYRLLSEHVTEVFHLRRYVPLVPG